MNLTCTLEDIISPYFTDWRYLKEVEADYPFIRGRFEIPHSSYVDDTGHFNAVEAFVCLNQLAYAGVMHFLQEGAIGSAGKVPTDIVFKAQLGSSYIVNIERFIFKKPIDARDFKGEIKILKTMGFYRPTEQRNTFFISTEDSFRDHEEGKASGRITFATVLESSPQNL